MNIQTICITMCILRLSLGTVLASEGTDGIRTALKADDLSVVQAGERVYQAQCASCHGPDLEGQPNWRSRDANGYLPAPPHDATGHTWHHADDLLFEITKYGPSVVIADESYRTLMPQYEKILSDEDIIAVLSFIKNTWPEEQRSWQEEVNGTQRNGFKSTVKKKSSLIDKLLKQRHLLQDKIIRYLYYGKPIRFIFPQVVFSFLLETCTTTNATEIVEIGAEIQKVEITDYSSPTFDCYEGQVTYLEEKRYRVTAIDHENIDTIETELGLPDNNLKSCHTAIVEGYIIEGHVPANDIERLLSERPTDIKGLSAPGMPMMSPGMASRAPKYYAVLSFTNSGETAVFSQY